MWGKQSIHAEHKSQQHQVVVKKTNIVLRCTDRNKSCKTHIASPTPLSINKTATKFLCSVSPDAECKEDEPKERSGKKEKSMKKAGAHLGH